MKFANLQRETKIILMDEQIALSKLQKKLVLIAQKLSKITKNIDFRTYTIFDQKSMLLTILVKRTGGKLSHFSVVIDVNDTDKIKKVQHKMLKSIRKIN